MRHLTWMKSISLTISIAENPHTYFVNPISQFAKSNRKNVAGPISAVFFGKNLYRILLVTYVDSRDAVSCYRCAMLKCTGVDRLNNRVSTRVGVSTRPKYGLQRARHHPCGSILYHIVFKLRVALINRFDDHGKKLSINYHVTRFGTNAWQKMKICSAHSGRRTCRTSMAPVATRCRRWGEDGCIVEMEKALVQC